MFNLKHTTMTKKIYYFIALLLFSFACEQFLDQPTGNVNFADGTSFTLQFDADGGVNSISFTADSNWTLSTSEAWINVSKSSGTASDTTFDVEVETNNTLEVREGYVEMSTLNNKSYRFVVIQTGEQPTFTINGNGEYSVLAKGGNVNVKLETNLEYEVGIPTSAKSWISLSNTRTVRDETLTFVVAANKTLDERRASINIVNEDNNVLKTIVIVQQGEEETFSLSQTSYTIDENGGEVKIKVSTNLEYIVEIPTEAKAWLSVADTRTIRTETLVFTVSPNDTLYAREAFVSISASNGKKYTLKFTQKAMTRVFTLDRSYILFNTDGGSVEVAVTTNVDYKIEVDNTATWLTYDKTRATTTDTILFSASALATGSNRVAEVKFTDASGNNLATLNVEQDSSFRVTYTTNDGKPVALYSTDGFGANYLGNNYDSTSGRGWLRFDTAITAIPKQAFSRCTNLTTVDIPNSVTSIGVQAFYGCSAMQEIVIPESITAVGSEAFVDCGGKVFVNCNIDTDYSFCDEFSFKDAGFKEVVIGDNVEIIGYSAFSGAKNVSKLTLGKNVKEIRSFAFSNNNSIRSVVIPDSVTTIGYWSFYGCDYLVSLTIGAGVTAMDGPYIRTSSLHSVYCKAVTPPTNADEYYSIFTSNKDFVIYVPQGSVDAYKSADAWFEYADLIVAYDFENDKIAEPNYTAHPRDKWVGVWNVESSKTMTIKDFGSIVVDNNPYNFEVVIVAHPSFDNELLIYGLSATEHVARCYVDDNGDINLVNGMSVGYMDGNGYEPTWLMYAELNGNPGLFKDQMVSYVFKMNGDTATATPVTETLSNGAKFEVLATYVFGLNSDGSIGYYIPSGFPIVSHAGTLSLTRCATRASQLNVELSDSPALHISDVRVSSLEGLR